MTDLSKIDPAGDADAGYDLVLQHPVDGTLLDVVIQIVGHDGKAFADEILRQRRLVLTEQKLQTTQEKEQAEEDDAINLLAACTTGWKNLKWEGKELKFSKENCIMLYRERKWIRMQIEAGVVNRQNFKRA